MKRLIALSTAALMTGTAAIAATPAELQTQRDMTQNDTVIVTDGTTKIVPGEEVYKDESRQLLRMEQAEVSVFSEDGDDELSAYEIQ
ncbi:hypothetical protein [Pseudooceanicola aestuarii]|uniref:hypothetical protein n=1 Tax=Pseudooceanicola aestuarii TaxID=2697319 RepID=UPI0013D36F32|nr:hypothetical protein [Pseudooceanicola aestuarii]